MNTTKFFTILDFIVQVILVGAPLLVSVFALDARFLFYYLYTAVLLGGWQYLGNLVWMGCEWTQSREEYFKFSTLYLVFFFLLAFAGAAWVFYYLVLAFVPALWYLYLTWRQFGQFRKVSHSFWDL